MSSAESCRVPGEVPTRMTNRPSHRRPRPGPVTPAGQQWHCAGRTDEAGRPTSGMRKRRRRENGWRTRIALQRTDRCRHGLLRWPPITATACRSVLSAGKHIGGGGKNGGGEKASQAISNAVVLRCHTSRASAVETTALQPQPAEASPQRKPAAVGIHFLPRQTSGSSSAFGRAETRDVRSGQAERMMRTPGHSLPDGGGHDGGVADADPEAPDSSSRESHTGGAWRAGSPEEEQARWLRTRLGRFRRPRRQEAASQASAAFQNGSRAGSGRGHRCSVPPRRAGLSAEHSIRQQRGAAPRKRSPARRHRRRSVARGMAHASRPICAPARRKQVVLPARTRLANEAGVNDHAADPLAPSPRAPPATGATTVRFPARWRAA